MLAYHPPTDFLHPLEILFVIAHQLKDDYINSDRYSYGLCFNALKSFRQVNRALYHSVNPIFWPEALRRPNITARVFTSIILSNDLARLKYFLGLSIDIERWLPELSNYIRSGYYKERGSLAAAAANRLHAFYLENGAKTECVIHSARSAEMVQLLVDFQADPENRDLDNLTSLHCYAQERGRESQRCGQFCAAGRERGSGFGAMGTETPAATLCWLR
jgi:hypothetical protein